MESSWSDSEPQVVVRINTHGQTHPDIEADQNIITDKKDNDKRRTVKLERSKLSIPWGFTLQSYGIYNPAQNCVENYTYVDYVDIKSPAYAGGVKKGDIIFAVNGQSTENYTHELLVDKIKSCKHNMRMVLVNANICQKIELHQRRQKLQALLRQKQSELKGLEKREAALFYNAKARLRYQQRQTAQLKQSQTLAPSPSISCCDSRSITSMDSNSSVETVPSTTESFSKLSIAPKSSSSEQETSFITENNNYRIAPSKQQMDVRPKTTAALKLQQTYSNTTTHRTTSPSVGMTRAIKTKMTST